MTLPDILGLFTHYGVHSAGSFQFYDVMMLIIPSTAHGHSSFCSTRSNNAVQVPADASDDNEDIPGVFSLLWD